MSEGDSGHPDRQASGEGAQHSASIEWQSLLGRTAHALSSGGYAANFIAGFILLLLGPIVAITMSNPRIAIYSAATGLTLLVWIVALVMVRQISPPTIPSNAGVLKPTATVSPKRVLIRQLEIGNSGTVFVQVGTEGAPIFKFCKDTELMVESFGGEIRVSTAINDRSGRLIAKLTRNEWSVQTPPTTWDRNYNHDALEVIDDRGDVALQIRVKPDRIQIQGKWYEPNGNGRGWSFVESPDGSGGLMQVLNPQHPENEIKIKPMFRYPSALHLGELAEPR